MSTYRPPLAATALAALAVAATGFTIGRRVGGNVDVAGDVSAPEANIVAAQAAPGPVYAVPVLDMLGKDDVCQSWLAVQNVGRESTQAVLVVLGGAAPGTAGDPLHSFPVGVMCTGLIQPGSSWHMLGALIPTGEDPNPPPTPGGGSLSARQRSTPVRVGRRAALVFSVAPDRLADILDDPDGSRTTTSPPTGCASCCTSTRAPAAPPGRTSSRPGGTAAPGTTYPLAPSPASRCGSRPTALARAARRPVRT